MMPYWGLALVAVGGIMMTLAVFEFMRQLLAEVREIRCLMEDALKAPGGADAARSQASGTTGSGET